MSKPIFIVRVPSLEFYDELEKIKLDNLIRKNIKGYKILVIFEKIDSFKFECFNAKDLKNEDKEFLKQLIEKNLKL